MKKAVLTTLSVAATGISVASALFSSSAFATSPGQLAGGANLYQVRNVTQNSPANAYGSSISATCGDTVKYSIEISNTQYGTLNNVTVTAPASGQIHVSATTSANQTVTSDGSVNVSLDKGTLNYVAGSTKLYSIDGKLIKTLSDGIATTGVNAGDLNGSTREFVQYQATVNCPTPTPTPTPTTTTTTTPAPLPSTGAGDMVLPALGLAGIAAAAVYAVRARRSIVK